MGKIIINSDKWKIYADAVGDKNPIHRCDVFAKNTILKNVIAPGMYLVSHVQGNFQIREAEFNFRKPVYDGDKILREGGSFYNDKGIVCEGNVTLGEPTGKTVSLPKGIFSYNSSVTKENLKDFYDSIGFKGERNSHPEMYLMALSAPALLNYGESMGFVGVHASQSIEVCKPFGLNDVRVRVSVEEKIKINKRVCIFNLYWRLEDEVVAVGESKVLPISI
ncbi:MaoC family dehydratase [Candidatus Pacearchaeota archaeon]|nr:MaoC family dehydratase [Candidatus Pacearchaeota archaeon]